MTDTITAFNHWLLITPQDLIYFLVAFCIVFVLSVVIFDTFL